MRIIPQRDEGKPPCPRSGIGGGPIHPAHAMEVIIADRVYAVTPKDADGNELPEFDAVSMASSRQGGMELYTAHASPVQPQAGIYYYAPYFYCLTCGFCLPAIDARR